MSTRTETSPDFVVSPESLRFATLISTSRSSPALVIDAASSRKTTRLGSFNDKNAESRDAVKSSNPVSRENFDPVVTTPSVWSSAANVTLEFAGVEMAPFRFSSVPPLATVMEMSPSTVEAGPRRLRSPTRDRSVTVPTPVVALVTFSGSVDALETTTLPLMLSAEMNAAKTFVPASMPVPANSETFAVLALSTASMSIEPPATTSTAVSLLVTVASKVMSRPASNDIFVPPPVRCEDSALKK